MDLAAARTWGAYPCPDPATVTGLLVVTAPRHARAQHSKPAHVRYHQSAVLTDSDRDRLDWFRSRIRHHVQHDGLRPDHVPSMLPTPKGEGDRGPGAWLSLTRAATAMHLLIAEATGHTETPQEAMTALGVPGIPSSVLIDGVHTGQGLREQDALLPTGALEVLFADGLIDYRRRRDTFCVLHRLPEAATRHLSPTATDRDGFGQLALAWMWTRFTHGPMRSSPWPTTPDREVAAFDSQLDPETQLVLHETGQHLLADTDLFDIPATRTTGAASTRRHG